MKPTNLQRKICELIKTQASFWMNSNDINSPTHYDDIQEEVDNVDELSYDAKDELVKSLSDLYHLVKIYNS